MLGTKGLSLLINRAVLGGYLSGYRIRDRRGEQVQITHLLFADDTLVFCENSRDQLVYLRVNLGKSTIIPVVKSGGARQFGSGIWV